MPRTLTAQDRARITKLASSMPAGSAERKAILAGLSKSAGDVRATLSFVPRHGLMLTLPNGESIIVKVDHSDLVGAINGGAASVTVNLPPNETIPTYFLMQLIGAEGQIKSALSALSKVLISQK